MVAGGHIDWGEEHGCVQVALFELLTREDGGGADIHGATEFFGAQRVGVAAFQLFDEHVKFHADTLDQIVLLMGWQHDRTRQDLVGQAFQT